MKSFNIPEFYRSPIISKLKAIRSMKDPKKQDFSPTVLDFGTVKFYIARHFGFCFGVENAVEISFRAIEENPGKRIFLLSQMIHNPEVNGDLISRGVQFIMDTNGNQVIPWEKLNKEDVVIIPAFGTTTTIEAKLNSIGIEPKKYNTTCPFVERVWHKSEQLGRKDYTIILHGKPTHEETRATFSQSIPFSLVIIVKDLEETNLVCDFINGLLPRNDFDKIFTGRTSPDFDPEKDLQRVGVINQTTMLSTDTQEIADLFKTTMLQKYGEAELKNHFADTRDTLCYATNENQDATYELLKQDADLAIVVGGYNSSNTSHLVELCERKFPTYFIKDDSELVSDKVIHHFDLHEKDIKQTMNWLPNGKTVNIILTSGASCPDSVVDRVLQKILLLFEGSKSVEEVLKSLN
ncbi:4-hydroxy-3-methylbut-2-enyl diphosphate reductase [soil metagenome]